MSDFTWQEIEFDDPMVGPLLRIGNLLWGRPDSLAKAKLLRGRMLFGKKIIDGDVFFKSSNASRFIACRQGKTLYLCPIVAGPKHKLP